MKILPDCALNTAVVSITSLSSQALPATGQGTWTYIGRPRLEETQQRLKPTATKGTSSAGKSKAFPIPVNSLPRIGTVNTSSGVDIKITDDVAIFGDYLCGAPCDLSTMAVKIGSIVLIQKKRGGDIPLL